VGKNGLRKLACILCFLTSAAAAVAFTGCSGAGTQTTTGEAVSTTGSGDSSGPLAFPVDNYTVQTKTVSTSDGAVGVTYHLYQHLTYVASPVDADYQSLDVAVPVEIDGRAIDAAGSPMLFDISVGGYMSSANSNATGTSARGAGGGAPSGSAPGSGQRGTPDGKGSMTSNSDLALAAGYVVVSPGCRGRDNTSSDGTHYGKAPAAIVDLKCAVKYIRYNDDLIPGNADWIISTGSSAGGALSALLGASGDSGLYQSYFDGLAAADASDAIYASACYCPITDLDHADSAYEWEFGTTPLGSGLVDQALSRALAGDFNTYLTSLGLTGKNGYGTLSVDNYGEYAMQAYLVPSANRYLSALPDSERQTYLAAHPWIKWSGSTASFTWKDYVTYVGRMKGLPAFDSFDLGTPECILFGDATTDARHFTDFSLQQTGDRKAATIDASLRTVVDLMNPMYFIGQKNSGCAAYWWIRHGTKDNDTSLPVIIDLATSLENLGKEVNATLYWDAGHGANEDPADFVAWMAAVTGYSK
jgi:acetyl esterase/lipase